MTDWRKLLVDEQLWDYRCKAVPVPLVREIVEEVETLRQDLAAARALLGEARGIVHTYLRGWPNSDAGELMDRIDAALAGGKRNGL